MFIGRTIIGLGAGITSVVVPTYLSDVIIRGLLGLFHQSSLVIGILTSQTISFWLGNEKYWILYFLCGANPSLLMLLLSNFCPESPVFFMCCDDKEQCEKILFHLRPPRWNVSGETEEIQKEIIISKLDGRHVSILNLITIPVARKSLLFCLGMHFTQQFSGLDLVLLFPKSWFDNPRTISVFIGFTILIATLVAIWLVERSGRRKLTLVSTMGCCIGLTFLSIFSYLNLNTWWKFLMLILYISSFSIGLGPITWIIINDIFPPDTRASAMTLAVSVNCLSKFIVIVMYKPLYDKFKSLAFLPFCFVLFLFFWYAFFQMKETKGIPASYL